MDMAEKRDTCDAGALSESDRSATFLPFPLARREDTRTQQCGAAPASSSARLSWIALGTFALVIIVHATSSIDAYTYTAIALAGLACATIGLRRHRPLVQWPWWALVGAGLVWTVSGIAEYLTDASGDLTSSRSLLPDAIALPGYALFGSGLIGLLRARQAKGERGVLLDSIMVGAGAFLLVNVAVITPTMDIKDTWVMARLSVAIYPALSMGLLALATHLAFSAGGRSPALRLLLVGTGGLVVGDFVYALGEAHVSNVPRALLEVPLLLAPACIGSAVLHPSIRVASTSVGERVGTMTRSRLAAVACALLAPIAVITTTEGAETLTLSVLLCLILAGAAILRLATAMTEQAAFEARLSHQANHDALTGLPNRVQILEHISEMLGRSYRADVPIAVMFIDLDQFKLVNDSMGHAVGDQLLVLASQRISSVIRQTDVVGRISGDEFVVIVNLETSAAVGLGQRIASALADVFVLSSGEVFISASIGITVAYASSETSAATMIQEADTAMYRSKEAGRNCITVFDSSMRERVARHVEVQTHLRRALNDRLISAYYQPLVTLPSGRIYGFEALARWNDNGTMISPAEFIPAAEESGLIVPLGSFMLDEACRQLSIWRQTLPGCANLHVSVNLSPRQMRESDIVDTVAETLLRYDLPGDALWLEITENVMMDDSVTTAGVMHGLRNLGVRLAVDDFGTGYSSLSYLKRFPVSSVKIDRSFVSGLGQHDSDASLVAAIVAMGSAFDLDLVAEGVETQDQAQRLLALGCRQAQGYLFGKPMPAEQVADAVQRLGVAGPAPVAVPPRRCAATARRV